MFVSSVLCHSSHFIFICPRHFLQKKKRGAECPPEYFAGSSVLCSAGIYFTYQKCKGKEREALFKRKFSLLLTMRSRASNFFTEADFFLKQELKCPLLCNEVIWSIFTTETSEAIRLKESEIYLSVLKEVMCASVWFVPAENELASILWMDWYSRPKPTVEIQPNLHLYFINYLRTISKINNYNDVRFIQCLCMDFQTTFKPHIQKLLEQVLENSHFRCGIWMILNDEDGTRYQDKECKLILNTFTLHKSRGLDLRWGL